MPAPSLLTLTAQDKDSPRTLSARRGGTVSGTLIASAAYTSTQTGLTFNVPPGGTAQCFVAVTAASGTGGLTVRFEMQDPTSGNWYGVCTASAATISVGSSVYSVGPGSTRTGGMSNYSALAYQYPIVGNCRVVVNHGDASSYTYSANVQVIGPG